jgi:hypothetical protein
MEQVVPDGTFGGGVERSGLAFIRRVLLQCVDAGGTVVAAEQEAQARADEA